MDQSGTHNGAKAKRTSSRRGWLHAALECTGKETTMLNRIKSILGGGPVSDPSQEHERIQVATCVVLLEMAHADEEFHAMEETLVRDLLQRKFEISDQDVTELIEFAQAQRRESLDLFQFTRQINEHFTRSEKMEMMEALWRLVYADGVLDKYEDYLVRQLATLLRLAHGEMIAAKVKVLDELRPVRPSRKAPPAGS
jgi:uncharacterized tellurite resistance protein B-like protein